MRTRHSERARAPNQPGTRSAPQSAEAITPTSVPAVAPPSFRHASAVTLRPGKASTADHVAPPSVDRRRPLVSVPARITGSEEKRGETAIDCTAGSPGRLSMARHARPAFGERKRPEFVPANMVWSTSKLGEHVRASTVRSCRPGLPLVQVCPPSLDRSTPSCSVPTSTRRSWAKAGEKAIDNTRLPTSAGAPALASVWRSKQAVSRAGQQESVVGERWRGHHHLWCRRYKSAEHAPAPGSRLSNGGAPRASPPARHDHWLRAR